MDSSESKTPSPTARPVVPWNKGAFVGPKPPLKPKQVWSVRLNLQRDNRVVVEYALPHVDAPIGVAHYRLLGANALPKALAVAIPTFKKLEPGILPGEGADDT